MIKLFNSKSLIAQYCWLINLSINKRLFRSTIQFNFKILLKTNLQVPTQFVWLIVKEQEFWELQNLENGRRDRIWTYDPLVPNQLRYQAALLAEWGGWWDLNPRQPESQSGALPTELQPPYWIESDLHTSGALDRIWTCDLWLRRPTLYPTELRALEASLRSVY